MQPIVRDALGFCALLLVAAGAGVAINHARKDPLPLIYRSKSARLEHAVQSITINSPTSNSSAVVIVSNVSIPLVTLDDFKRCVDSRAGIVLDARPEALYHVGHVPGALSLPRSDFEAAYLRLKSQLEKDFAQSLIVYCSDADCDDSALVASALRGLGYEHVSRFKGGWEDWTKEHQPEERTP
jgi:rhodanese-related sulfurtransferase